MGKKRDNTVYKEQKQARRLAAIRKGYAEAAAATGVSHLVAKLPLSLKQYLLRMPTLEPTVMADAVSADRPKASVVGFELRRALEKAVVKLGNGSDFSAAGLLSFCIGLQNCFSEILIKLHDPALRRMAIEGQKRVRAFHDQYFQDATLNLVVAVRLAAANRSRIDKELISFTLDWQQTPSGRRRAAIIFTLTDPQQIDVCLDGDARPAFRCGGHRGPHAPLEWVNWPASVISLDGEDKEYPVYVQRHALRRIEQRLNELGSAAAHFWMWESLRNPKIISIDGDCCTIEYRFFEHRLGYLLARCLPDYVLVTTFKFLTMQGSAEARLLHEKLRLSRREIEYQKLDELSTFTATDLLDDPQLLEIFSQCGCGHLAAMKKLMGKESQSYAAEIRKYLRLDEERERQRLDQRLGLRLASTSDEEAIGDKIGK